MSETDTRCDEIRARLDAATSGPWRICDDPDEDDQLAVRADDTTWIAGIVPHADGADDRYSLANAEFIVHARDDIAFLLAERDALTRECARLRVALASWRGEVQRLRAKAREGGAGNV